MISESIWKLKSLMLIKAQKFEAFESLKLLKAQKFEVFDNSNLFDNKFEILKLFDNFKLFWKL